VEEKNITLEKENKNLENKIKQLEKINEQLTLGNKAKDQKIRDLEETIRKLVIKLILKKSISLFYNILK
jgi:hypothetical protein